MSERRQCAHQIEGPSIRKGRHIPLWRRQCKRLARRGESYCWQHITGWGHGHGFVTIEAVMKAATEVYTPEGVLIWVDAPNPMLEGKSARECVEAGEGSRVLDLIDALASGAVL